MPLRKVSKSTDKFDEKLSRECAKSFSISTGLGCTVSLSSGEELYECGYGCKSCKICSLAGVEFEKCVESQTYGMTEAERFGGKYIYYCPMGLTCFVSPIVSEDRAEARITVGPFMMVEQEDYIFCELTNRISNDALVRTIKELKNIPYVSPSKVTELSNLLFMAVGFMNNVYSANQMLEAQSAKEISGQITSYISQLKSDDTPAPYPFDIERDMLKGIADGERDKVHQCLNMILGHIFFSHGQSLEVIKPRVYELLVLIGRSAIENGADPEKILLTNQEYLNKITQFESVEELSLWLSKAANYYMDELFRFKDAKHSNAIHRCTQYISANYAEKITLEQMAERVYFSPAYLSRVFKEETGVGFSTYLANVRIEKSKTLMKNKTLTLSEIAQAVGFEDQSYFTKTFKRVTGETPKKYSRRFSLD